MLPAKSKYENTTHYFALFLSVIWATIEKNKRASYYMRNILMPFCEKTPHMNVRLDNLRVSDLLVCFHVSCFFFWQKQILQIHLLFISMNRPSWREQNERASEAEKVNGNEKWTFLIAKWSIWIWFVWAAKNVERTIKCKKKVKTVNWEKKKKKKKMSCGWFFICVNVLNPSWHLLETRKQMKSNVYS